jgi:hypothetical protein
MKNWLPDRCMEILMLGEILHKSDFECKAVFLLKKNLSVYLSLY